jgi:signal recognition particle receptor subunit beta
MIEYDELGKKMVLKLVYYGPAMSGKTTNLLRLHDVLCKEGRGDLMVLDTKNDRTIYFDLLPFFLVAPSGLKIKVKAYTVPGQVQHDSTRKAVLQRCDGVAFIADSRTDESLNNAGSFENLEKNLSIVGIDIEQVPLVVQFNKRDLEAVVTEQEVLGKWGPTGIPIFFASALYGQGVVETFSRVLDMMYGRIDRKYALAENHGLSKEAFVQALTRTVPG